MSCFQYFIQIVLALAAISASFFAAITYSKNIKAKRAYLAAEDNPGFLNFSNIHKNLPIFFLSFLNYGMNPAKDIIVQIAGYNSHDVNGTNDSPSPMIKWQFTASNPIPQNSKFNISYDKFAFYTDENDEIAIATCEYIICNISYCDSILKTKFKDVFFWNIARDYKLVEINQIYYDKMLELSSLAVF